MHTIKSSKIYLMIWKLNKYVNCRIVNNVLGPLVTFAKFGILIWGCVIVFGKLKFFAISNDLFIVQQVFKILLFEELYLYDRIRWFKIIFHLLTKGSYSSVQYDDPQSDGYCAKTPFMYSFVMLIIGFCTVPFLIFCLCSAAICAMFASE